MGTMYRTKGTLVDDARVAPQITQPHDGVADPMKAIVQDRYGSADVLELRDIDVPGVGSDDVLLRVRAASAHIGDWHMIAGRPGHGEVPVYVRNHHHTTEHRDRGDGRVVSK